MVKSIVLGGAIFAGGFGALSLFWRFGSWQEDIPGQYSYRAAVVGDSVLLPASAAVLFYLLSGLPPVPRERAVAWISAVVGCATGATVQWIWIRDPDPSLNWTVPVAGTFTAPGWYHAVFLVITSGVFASLITRLLWRLRHVSRTDSTIADSLIDSPSFAFWVGSLIGFAGLVGLDGVLDTLDGYPVVSTMTGWAAILATAVGVAIGLGLLLWTAGNDLLRHWRTMLYSLLLAVSICVAFSWPFAGEYLLISMMLISPALTVAFAAMLRHEGSSWWWMRALIAGLALFWTMRILIRLAEARIEVAIIALPLLLMCVGAIVGIFDDGLLRPRTIHTSRMRTMIQALLLPMLMVIAAAYFHKQQVSSYFVTVFISVAFATIGIRALKILGTKLFTIIKIEEDRGPSRSLESSFWSVWIVIDAVFFASFASLAGLIAVVGSSLNIDVEGALRAPSRGLTVAAIAAIAAAIPIVVMKYAPRHAGRNHSQRIGIHHWTIASIVAASLVWGVAPWLIVTNELSLLPDTRSIITALAAVVIGCLIGAAVIDSFRANIATLHFCKFHVSCWIAVSSVGVASASMTYWFLSKGLWSDGFPLTATSAMGLLGAVAYGGAAFVSATAFAITKSLPRGLGQDRYFTLHHPATNITHDVNLFGHLIMLYAMLTFIADRIGRSTTDSSMLAHVTDLSPLASFVWIMMPMILINMKHHVGAERKRLPSPGLIAWSDSLDIAKERHNEMVNNIESRFGRIGLVLNVVSLHIILSTMRDLYYNFTTSHEEETLLRQGKSYDPESADALPADDA